MSKQAIRYLKFPESKLPDEDEYLHQKKVWIPDSTSGYRLCSVLDETQRDISVGFRDSQGFFEKKRILHNEALPVSRNVCADDLCTLTEPNPATVLDSLHQRYSADIIHTYSGLFCLFINPWHNLPIYSSEVMNIFRSKLELTPPPHVFAVAQAAYDGIRRGGANQAILITGESGAGKTENTKRIIEYVLNSCGAAAQRVGQDVIACGELLEAFGNAATMANNNSSRFGKFIRINFNEDAKMLSAAIDCYLLEKSRVVNQNPGERNFHVFYQLLAGAFGHQLRGSLGLHFSAEKYKFLNQGGEYASAIDDDSEGSATDAALIRLGFSEDERVQILEVVAVCILLGQIEIRERSGLDISYVEGTTEIDATCSFLGVRSSALADCLTQPTIKVGDNVIRKNQNLKKSLASIAALTKTLYERLFQWILEKCNSAIGNSETSNSSNSKVHTIGVLDIAGFEILQRNSFEQLCINYTNEKLQQFFNHFMFVREQTAYLEEGLSWTQHDYALDLQQTIDIFERPLGILSLLEEECVVPKGSESSLLAKWTDHLKDCEQFTTVVQSKNNHTSDFAIRHYAGQVFYSTKDWLEKNRDSVDAAIIDTLHESVQPLIAQLFPNSGARRSAENDKPRRGGLATGTVSFVYKQQLCTLMDSLNDCNAHFIRCILPNKEKMPKKLDAALVLHQLRCNGVLEGIRICRQGFPNRLPFDEFINRYGVLVSADYKGRGRAGARELLDVLDFDSQRIQLGTTRVFCKVGVISELEEKRKAELTRLIIGVQTSIRSYLAEMDCKIRQKKEIAISRIQNSVRTFNHVSQWPWFKLLHLVLPQIPRERELQKIKELEEKLNELENEKLKALNDNKELCLTIENLRNSSRADQKKAEEAKLALEKMLETKMRELHTARCEMADNEEIFDLLETKYKQQQNRIAEMTEAMREYERKFERLDYERIERDKEIAKLKEQLDKERFEADKKAHELIKAQATMHELEERMDAFVKEERRLVETVANLESSLQDAADRAKRQADLISEQQKNVAESTERLTKADAQLGEERNLRRKIERELEKTKDEIKSIKKDAEGMIEKYDSIKSKIKDKDNVIKKLEKKLADKDSLMEQCIKEVKETHKHRVEELNNTIDEMRRKTSRLENENLSHKTMLERVDSNQSLNFMGRSLERVDSIDSDLGRSQASSGRMSMSSHSLSRQYSITSVPSFSTIRSLVKRRETEPDLYNSITGLSRVPSVSSLSEQQRKINELERHLQDSKTELNLKNRELEVYKSQLHAMEQEKDSLLRQNKALTSEVEQLKREITSLQRSNQNLEHRIKSADDETQHWRNVAEENMQEQLATIEAERKKTVEMLEETVHEKNLKATHIHALERSRAELQDELTRCQLDLDHALSQISSFEKASRAQEEVGHNWESEYRTAMAEVESLRDENCALKSKIRRQYKQIEILTRDEDATSALNTLHEKVTRLGDRLET